MYRFCLIREVENLHIAKSAAQHEKQLPQFYNVLSMRQVFTIPPSGTETDHGRALDLLPKLICALPVVVQLTVTSHDIITTGIGNLINAKHNLVLIALEVIFSGYILLLTRKVILRIIEIDSIWKKWWDDIHAQAGKQPEMATSESG